MSIRRAVENHFKLVIDEFVPSVAEGWAHQVVESLRLEDRPLPSVVVIAGQATPAFNDLVDSLGNYNVPVTLAVMSSIDDTTVNKHAELAYFIGRLMSKLTSRKNSRTQGLRFYDVVAGAVAQENQGRRMVTVLNYETIVNYQPESPML